MQIMNCKEVIHLIPFYLDDELDPVRKQQTEQHFRSCPACEGYYQRFRQVYGVPEKEILHSPDPYFYTRLMANIEARQEQPFVRIFQVKPLVWALAVMLPMITGIWLGYSLMRKQDNTYENTALIAEVNNVLSTPGYTSDNDTYYHDNGQ